MPLYISIAALNPRVVHWVCSDDTRQCKDDLLSVVSKKWPEIKHQDNYYITDAHSPRHVRDTMSHLPQEAALNYTGGTKVMTVHAHAYWMTHLGGRPGRSLYVDGRNGFIRFDDGTDEPLSGFDIDLSIDDAISMHGLERIGPKVISKDETGIRPGHWRALARWAVDSVDQVPNLYNACRGLREKPGAARNGPIDLSFLPSDVLPDFASVDGWPVGSGKRVAKEWGEFFTGGWLEKFAQEVMQNVDRKYSLELAVAGGVRPEPMGPARNRDSELDVVVVRGYRIYLVSCTTASKASSIKPKCYEALNRIRLIGGGLAKAAVVCLASPSDALAVEERVRIGWQGEEGTVKVFGSESVRSWLNGDYLTLLDWLE